MTTKASVCAIIILYNVTVEYGTIGLGRYSSMYCRVYSSSSLSPRTPLHHRQRPLPGREGAPAMTATRVKLVEDPFPVALRTRRDVGPETRSYKYWTRSDVRNTRARRVRPKKKKIKSEIGVSRVHGQTGNVRGKRTGIGLVRQTGAWRSAREMATVDRLKRHARDWR